MKHSASKPGISRRQFLAATSVALAAPTFIPASALGRQGQSSPSNRITMGVVGWGMQGPGNTNEFLNQPDCKVVAACDLDKNHLQAAVETINKHYGNQDCKAYHDYRELMTRTDIDTVMLAVPDTWHALVAIEAAKNKKDIYGEKPLARTIAEQQAIVKAVQDNKRIWQTGSWQRSEAKYRKAAEIVRNGLIGKVTHVEVGLPSGHHDFAGTAPELIEKLSALPEKPKDLSKITPHHPGWMLAISPPPPELDYKTWLGPSQEESYIKARVHMNWRWNYNVGGGQLLDWIGHHCDIAHWGLDCEQSGGPYEIEGTGLFPPKDAIWNTCTKYKIICKYPNDVTMTIADERSGVKMGAKWIGTEGWVYVDRSGYDASDVDWFREIPADRYKVKLYNSKNHWANFIECVKSRKPTIAPVETAHHSAIPGHLGLIAMLVGRKIKWDAEKQVIVDDEGASKLLSRSYRSPWQLT